MRKTFLNVFVWIYLGLLCAAGLAVAVARAEVRPHTQPAAARASQPHRPQQVAQTAPASRTSITASPSAAEQMPKEVVSESGTTLPGPDAVKAEAARLKTAGLDMAMSGHFDDAVLRLRQVE